MKEITREWIAKADADLESAERELRRRSRANLDLVCFLAQQTIEKCLKARLQEASILSARTHDLEALINQLAVVERSLLLLMPVLKPLSAYAVVFRYPGRSATRREAREALAFAKQVSDPDFARSSRATTHEPVLSRFAAAKHANGQGQARMTQRQTARRVAVRENVTPVPIRVGVVLLAVATLSTAVGCHDPNDPNINPKAFHSLRRDAEAMAIGFDVRDNYDIECVSDVEPTTGLPLRTYTYTLRRELRIPRSFQLTYDPRRRSFKLITPQPASQPTVESSGTQSSFDDSPNTN